MLAIHSDDQPAVQALWEKSLHSGEVFNAEVRFEGADKEYRWFLAKALPLTKEGSIVSLKRSMREREDACERVRGRVRACVCACVRVRECKCKCKCELCAY
jgi:PAS domain-containing protein